MSEIPASEIPARDTTWKRAVAQRIADQEERLQALEREVCRLGQFVIHQISNQR